MKKALLGSTAAVLAFGLPATAYAQDADSSEAASALDDEDIIIVTATRRAQDVQDIPIAVTAVGPAQLERQGVVNITEVTSVAPSFSSSTAQIASGSVVLRIRGVGTTSNNIGFESAVGIFVDGAYQSRPGVALSEFVDVERVEVLRGPQGTLFGRNTSAGALNITNVRPDLSEFGGFANASYGNFNHISLQGAVNVPIVQDSVAVRVTGAYRKRDGFLTIVDRTGAEIGDTNDVDQFLVRGQVGFETEGGIRGRLIADYSKSTSSCCGAVEIYETPLVALGAFNAVGLGANGGNGQPSVSRNPFGQDEFQDAVDNRVVSANFAPESDVENYGVTAELEVPVSDSADLIFIGSYRNFDSFERYDSDFTDLDIFNVDPLLTKIETYTAELRFQGEAVGGRLNYMIGGYYSDEQINTEATFRLGSEYGENVGAFIGAVAGPNPLTLLTGGTVDPAGTVTTNAFNQSAQSYSVFTHNSFDITDRLSLTLGARYSFEEKEGGFNQLATNNQICPASVNAVLANLASPNVPLLVGLGCFGFTAPADLPASAALPLVRTFDSTFEDEELIYTINVGYEFAAPVNMYASFTHGYKSGGINLDTTAAVAGANPTFASEEVDAYEIGLKARLLDNAVTINLAAFHEEFTNFQVLEFTGTAFQTFNVPIAKSTGVELETNIRVSDELSINGGLTVLDARYPGDCVGTSTSVTVNSLCGNDLTNAPNIVALLGANYEQPISNNLKFFVSGQVRLESDQRTSTQAIVPPDAAAITAAGSLQAAIDAAPLIIGDQQDGSVFANLRAGFGNIDDTLKIEFYVNNLTDRVTRGVTFNTTLRGTGANNSRSAFTLAPRTYGVTVRTKF